MAARSLSRLTPALCCVALLPVAGARATGTSSPPPPPSERVFVTSVNNKILEVNFANGTATPVVIAKGSNFRGLAVRNDLHLAVADHNRRGSVKLFNLEGEGATITSAIAFPSGLTADSQQRLYVTNEHPGEPDEVWRIERNYAACLDGADPLSCAGAGYLPAVQIDAPVKVAGVKTKKLADLKVADGRLWVLVANPPMLLVYDEHETCSNPCEKRVAIDTGSFQGYSPSGLAFTGPEILVATDEGKVLRFDLTNAKNDDACDDSPLSPHFANTGHQLDRIAVGLQGGQLRAFVTAKPKFVKQYAFAANGTGTFLEAVGGLNSPVGVSLASAGAAVTGTGEGTEVVMSSIEATFESVTKAGLSDAWCLSFVDPRETSDTLADPACSLSEDLFLDDPRLPKPIRDLGFPNKIPRYVRAFRSGAASDTADSATGPPTFRFCHATTTAEFSTLVRVMGESEPQWLGYDPACNSESRFQRPRFFYSEEPPEPVLAEGRVFINNTSMCNRDTNDSWKMKSIYVTGARDTRPPDNHDLKVAQAALPSGECKDEAGVVDCQLNRLKAVLQAQTCVDSGFKSKLKHILEEAIEKFDCGEYEEAKEQLVRFEKKVRCEEADSEGAFAACPSSETSGELRSRARGPIFGLCDGLDAGLCPCNQTLAEEPYCAPVPACGY
jgi:hypothetical protein